MFRYKRRKMTKRSEIINMGYVGRWQSYKLGEGII